MLKKLRLFIPLLIAGAAQAMDVIVEGDDGVRRITIYSVDALKKGVHDKDCGVAEHGLVSLLRCAEARQWKVTPQCAIPAGELTVGLLVPIWLCIRSVEEQFSSTSPYIAALKAWGKRLEQRRKDEKRQLRMREKLAKVLGFYNNALAMERTVTARINTQNARLDDRERLRNLNSALEYFAEKINKMGGFVPGGAEDFESFSDDDTNEGDEQSSTATESELDEDFLDDLDPDDAALAALGTGISPNFCEPTPQQPTQCPSTPRKPKILALQGGRRP